MRASQSLSCLLLVAAAVLLLALPVAAMRSLRVRAWALPGVEGRLGAALGCSRVGCRDSAAAA